jgi:ankyrin repeat protein
MKLRPITLALTMAILALTPTPASAQSVQNQRPATRPAAPDKDIRLVLACAGGRAADALRLLREGCPVNSHTDRGETALYFAAASHREEMIRVVRELIAHGAEVNCRSQDDFTPLHQACCSGRHEVVEMLLNHGANVAAAEKNYGDQPLHVLAGCAGDREPRRAEAFIIAIMLIGHKADLNAKDKDGKTPLQCASEAERKDERFIAFLSDITRSHSKGASTQAVRK